MQIPQNKKKFIDNDIISTLENREKNKFCSCHCQNCTCLCLPKLENKYQPFFIRINIELDMVLIHCS